MSVRQTNLHTHTMPLHITPFCYPQNPYIDADNNPLVYRGVSASTNIDSSQHYTISTGSGSTSSTGSFKPTSTLTNKTDTAVNPTTMDYQSQQALSQYLTHRLSNVHNVNTGRVYTSIDDMLLPEDTVFEAANVHSERGFGISKKMIGKFAGKVVPTLGLATSLLKNLNLAKGHTSDVSTVGGDPDLFDAVKESIPAISTLWSSLFSQGKSVQSKSDSVTSSVYGQASTIMSAGVQPSMVLRGDLVYRGPETRQLKKHTIH